MATVAAILDLQSEQFLAIFDLQVTQILPTKFQVDWHFGSEEVQNKTFMMPFWISNRNNFS